MFDFFKREKKNPQAELKAFLGSFELQSFSSAVMNVLATLRDPESSMSEISSRIEMDPGMHVKVLQMVNSAGFGLAKKIGNLHHAVTLMGRSRLESMVLTFAVSNGLPPTMDCMEMSLFWQAAARRACLARGLAQHLHAATEAESFTLGLLQDIALPLICKAKPGEYPEILKEWHANPEANLAELERSRFGYDHASIGALMAEDWGLPETLINGMASHHDLSSESQADPAVRLVSYIKYSDEDNGVARLTETAQKEYGIHTHLVTEMLDKAFADAQEFARLFD
jgi:HD-like signal output (HDOD) protein